MGSKYGKYVYLTNWGYTSKFWDGRKLHAVGTFSTPEEAAYRQKIAKNGHHWDDMEPIGKYFGFTYMITNKVTGKRYIGKKQFYRWAGPQGGYKCTNPCDSHWDPKAWKDNEWKEYTGSSEELNEDIQNIGVWNFSFYVIEMCKNKLDLHLSEIKWMLNYNVLEATGPDGDYLFYNKNIASLEFRAPFKHADVVEAKKISDEAARHYYLKPSYCSLCGKVIPYGATKCCSVLPKDFSFTSEVEKAA